MRQPAAAAPCFSVVLPTYQRPRTLGQVLAGLAAQEWPPEQMEVLVVSDGGGDGSAELVRGFASSFPLRRLEQVNRGPAAARNLGIGSARGRLVLFLDDDVVPSPRLLAEHARSHAEAANRVVIGTRLEPAGPLRPWVRWECRTLAEQYEAMAAGRWSPTPYQFYTGNASVGIEHLRRAGGFDVSWRRAEDLELGFRLQRLGLQFVFNPAAAATHVADRSYRSWLDAAFQYGRNEVLFGKAEERAAAEFPHRHPLTRALVRAGLRRPALARRLPPLAQPAIRAADRCRLGGLALALCGATFNLQYWLGVAEGLGSAAAALQLCEGPGLLSRARSALPIGGRAGRQ